MLDGTGSAKATLDTLGPLDPGLKGLALRFAYMLSPNPFFASKAVTVLIEE